MSCGTCQTQSAQVLGQMGVPVSQTMGLGGVPADEFRRAAQAEGAGLERCECGAFKTIDQPCNHPNHAAWEARQSAIRDAAVKRTTDPKFVPPALEVRIEKYAAEKRRALQEAQVSTGDVAAVQTAKDDARVSRAAIASGELAPNEMADAIRMHNRARGALGMPPLPISDNAAGNLARFFEEYGEATGEGRNGAKERTARFAAEFLGDYERREEETGQAAGQPTPALDGSLPHAIKRALRLAGDKVDKAVEFVVQDLELAAEDMRQNVIAPLVGLVTPPKGVTRSLRLPTGLDDGSEFLLRRNGDRVKVFVGDDLIATLQSVRPLDELARNHVDRWKQMLRARRDAASRVRALDPVPAQAMADDPGLAAELADVSAVAAAAQAAAPAMERAGIPLREAYAAAVGHVSAVLPRCPDCGAWMSPTDPVCNNPRCRARGVEGLHEAQGWPPEGIAFKRKSRARRREDAPDWDQRLSLASIAKKHRIGLDQAREIFRSNAQKIAPSLPASAVSQAVEEAMQARFGRAGQFIAPADENRIEGAIRKLPTAKQRVFGRAVMVFLGGHGRRRMPKRPEGVSEMAAAQIESDLVNRTKRAGERFARRARALYPQMSTQDIKDIFGGDLDVTIHAPEDFAEAARLAALRRMMKEGKRGLTVGGTVKDKYGGALRVVGVSDALDTPVPEVQPAAATVLPRPAPRQAYQHGMTLAEYRKARMGAEDEDHLSEADLIKSAVEYADLRYGDETNGFERNAMIITAALRRRLFDPDDTARLARVARLTLAKHGAETDAGKAAGALLDGEIEPRAFAAAFCTAENAATCDKCGSPVGMTTKSVKGKGKITNKQECKACAKRERDSRPPRNKVYSDDETARFEQALKDGWTPADVDLDAFAARANGGEYEVMSSGTHRPLAGLYISKHPDDYPADVVNAAKAYMAAKRDPDMTGEAQEKIYTDFARAYAEHVGIAKCPDCGRYMQGGTFCVDCPSKPAVKYGLYGLPIADADNPAGRSDRPRIPAFSPDALAERKAMVSGAMAWKAEPDKPRPVVTQPTAQNPFDFLRRAEERYYIIGKTGEFERAKKPTPVDLGITGGDFLICNGPKRGSRVIADGVTGRPLGNFAGSREFETDEQLVERAKAAMAQSGIDIAAYHDALNRALETRPPSPRYLRTDSPASPASPAPTIAVEFEKEKGRKPSAEETAAVEAAVSALPDDFKGDAIDAARAAVQATTSGEALQGKIVFVCSNCRHQFSVRRPKSAGEPVRCPQCETEAVWQTTGRRLVKPEADKRGKAKGKERTKKGKAQAAPQPPASPSAPEHLARIGTKPPTPSKSVDPTEASSIALHFNDGNLDQGAGHERIKMLKAVTDYYGNGTALIGDDLRIEVAPSLGLDGEELFAARAYAGDQQIGGETTLYAGYGGTAERAVGFLKDRCRRALAEEAASLGVDFCECGEFKGMEEARCRSHMHTDFLGARFAAFLNGEADSYLGDGRDARLKALRAAQDAGAELIEGGEGRYPLPSGVGELIVEVEPADDGKPRYIVHAVDANGKTVTDSESEFSGTGDTATGALAEFKSLAADALDVEAEEMEQERCSVCGAFKRQGDECNSPNHALALAKLEKKEAAPQESVAPPLETVSRTDAPAAPQPSPPVGSKVRFMDGKGQMLTGTVTSVYSDGEASIKVDQIVAVGGVPIGRVATVNMKNLSADAPPADSLQPSPFYFKEGERVVLEDGRHGTISQANTGYMEVFGYGIERRREQSTFTFKVKMDSGREEFLIEAAPYGDMDTPSKKLRREGGAPAPAVAADPVWEGEPVDPGYVYRHLQGLPQKISNARSKMERARKAENKREWKTEMGRRQVEKERAGKVWDAWARSNPDDAAKMIADNGPLPGAKPLSAAQPPASAQERAPVPSGYGLDLPRASVTRNAEAGRIEIRFDAKPDGGARQTLRDYGYEWVKAERCWARAGNEHEDNALAMQLSGVQAKRQQAQTEAITSGTAVRFDRDGKVMSGTVEAVNTGDGTASVRITTDGIPEGLGKVELAKLMPEIRIEPAEDRGELAWWTYRGEDERAAITNESDAQGRTTRTQSLVMDREELDEARAEAQANEIPTSRFAADMARLDREVEAQAQAEASRSAENDTVRFRYVCASCGYKFAPRAKGERCPECATQAARGVDEGEFALQAARAAIRKVSSERLTGARDYQLPDEAAQERMAQELAARARPSVPSGQPLTLSDSGEPVLEGKGWQETAEAVVNESATTLAGPASPAQAEAVAPAGAETEAVAPPSGDGKQPPVAEADSGEEEDGDNDVMAAIRQMQEQLAVLDARSAELRQAIAEESG